MPFVQSCVLCGDHKRLMHDPHLTPCPTCASPYCRSCYSSLPKIKTGLLRKQPQCPRCAQGSQVARAPYTPYSMQPAASLMVAPSPQPPYSSALQAPQIREKEIITREVVKIKCRFCGNAYAELTDFCPFCGAPQRWPVPLLVDLESRRSTMPTAGPPGDTMATRRGALWASVTTGNGWTSQLC